MRTRVVSLLILILVSTSCEYFNFKKKSNFQEVDTIIDFSSVDTSPIFEACKSLIEKSEISNCFRATIHKYISESLAEQKIMVKQSIDETIKVDVLIDYSGKVSLQKIEASDQLKNAIPVIDSLLKVSLQELPKLFPATKRGIPVSTQYQIPIQITVE